MRTPLALFLWLWVGVGAVLFLVRFSDLVEAALRLVVRS
jgi:hypothetical protein